MLHLRGLGEESLARRTYEEQKSNKWSGLVGETEETCKKLGIENVHSTSLGAKTYRKLLTKALPKENENRIKQLAKEKNKCESRAVSAGHQSKSCSVYKKCEDIFFLEPFYFVTIFLPRSFLKISEGHLQKMFEVENHLNPPKQQNH